jgi:hypothetical protein
MTFTIRPFALALVLALAACGGKKPPNTTPPGGTDAPGTLSGTVHFVGTPCATPNGPPCDGIYPGYVVKVLAADGTTEVATATTGADGTFSLELPPGHYVILTQAGLQATDTKSTEVDVSRDALATVDLTVDTGVR